MNSLYLNLIDQGDKVLNTLRTNILKHVANITFLQYTKRFIFVANTWS